MIILKGLLTHIILEKTMSLLQVKIVMKFCEIEKEIITQRIT